MTPNEQRPQVAAPSRETEVMKTWALRGGLAAFCAAQAERAHDERVLVRDSSQQPSWRRLSGRGWVRAGERAGHIASTAHVQAVYPFVAQGGLGRAGVLVGRDVYGSGPFAVDPWHLYSLGLLHDANMLVLGLKDHGKSSLLKTWCFRQRVFDRRIEVFERKGEYRKVIEAMGGPTLTLKPGVHLNPIERVGSAEARESLLQAVASTMLGRELRPVEELGLSVALRSAASDTEGRAQDRREGAPHRTSGPLAPYGSGLRAVAPSRAAAAPGQNSVIVSRHSGGWSSSGTISRRPRFTALEDLGA